MAMSALDGGRFSMIKSSRFYLYYKTFPSEDLGPLSARLRVRTVVFRR